MFSKPPKSRKKGAAQSTAQSASARAAACYGRPYIAALAPLIPPCNHNTTEGAVPMKPACGRRSEVREVHVHRAAPQASPREPTQILRLWYNSIASASTGFAPNALALFNSRRVAPTIYPGGREQAGRGFAVSIATWRVYRRPGQPGGSFTGRRNAPAFTSASTPALSGKTVERWVDPLGLHFTKTLVAATLTRAFYVTAPSQSRIPIYLKVYNTHSQ